MTKGAFDLIMVLIVGIVGVWTYKEYQRRDDLITVELAHRGKVANPKYRRDEFGHCFYVDVGAGRNLVSVSCDNIPENQIVGIKELEEIKQVVDVEGIERRVK